MKSLKYVSIQDLSVLERGTWKGIEWKLKWPFSAEDLYSSRVAPSLNLPITRHRVLNRNSSLLHNPSSGSPSRPPRLKLSGSTVQDKTLPSQQASRAKHPYPSLMLNCLNRANSVLALRHSFQLGGSFLLSLKQFLLLLSAPDSLRPHSLFMHWYFLSFVLCHSSRFLCGIVTRTSFLFFSV